MTIVHALLVLLPAVSAQTYSQFVDHFIGTGGVGYGIGSVPPGAQAPFGAVRLSPDTVYDDNVWLDFNHFGGYYYGDTNVRLFSHTHMVGSGAVDYGTIGVMPSAKIPTSASVKNYGFRSRFSHDNEKASPGYYAVYLDDVHALAELSATTHVGAHRYTFDKSVKQPVILFDVSHTLQPKACGGSYVEVDQAAGEVRGYNLDLGGLSGRFDGVYTYFVAKISQPFSVYGAWNESGVQPGVASANSTTGGAYIGFAGPLSAPVEIFLGMSFISMDQARTNLAAEVGNNLSFDWIHNSTASVWESHLATIEAPLNASRTDLTKFYTALYHTFMAPTIFSEPGGLYRGFDKQVHQLDANQSNYYTDMSIWDVHRTEFPWLGLVQPNRQRDIVRSLLLMYQQGGDLPKWPMADGYTGCMTGSHAIIVLADAMAKGLGGFDAQLAYKAAKQEATTNQVHAGRTDITDWINKGYIPMDNSTRGCSETLEYAYDDWALGQMAAMLGYTADAALFANRSQNWRNNWNSEYKFFCPRDYVGAWECPPIWTDVFDERYVEGDAWHYRFYVPHDVPGLIQAFGSTDAFVDALDTFFRRQKDTVSNLLPNPYYWAGNEPDILSAWEFAWAGRIDLTQEYVRWNMEHQYLDGPDGLPGNDDYGTMSAWYLFASVGFYPLAGSPTYILGSPIFERVVMHLPTGDVTILAHGASAQNIYVQQVQLNGQSIDLKQPFIQHQKLTVPNSVLEFWMGPKPAPSLRP